MSPTWETLTAKQRKAIRDAAASGIRPNDRGLTEGDLKTIRHLETIGLLIYTVNRRKKPIWRPTSTAYKLLSHVLDVDPPMLSQVRTLRGLPKRSAPATSRSPHAAEILRYWRTVGMGDWFVYFIQQGKDGPIKIGRAADPPTRLGDLQCANPTELHLREVVLADLKTERTFHEHWHRAKIRGEWFGHGYEEEILSTACRISDDQREARRIRRLEFEALTGAVLIKALFAVPTEEVAA